MARILLIEDEPLLAAAVRRGLEEDHHVVQIAGDGTSGLAAALQEAHELVVLDLLLPGTPGLTICRRLRERGCNVPILMLTARDAPTDVVAGLDAGADDYLTKPFAFEVLLARVRTLLRRASGHAGPVFRVGPLELDPTARRVRRDGEDIALTPREHDLLEILVRRQGTVLSKRRIAQLLWSDGDEPDPNAIEVHVASLRRKIDRDRRPQLLRTVRGVGYVVRATE